uniref:Bifunctional demethylmenaquinone methyltransferase/2-methoxy-6-polyprenyl-1,4-benzoquinol methylase n=1 Tax=Parastrongyloides trichosuri TaxID=131310 RepID=A0A0N4ZLH6_PARTI
DLMNDLMSAGVHRIWKDATAAKLNVRPGEVVLDMAGGTGDMARRYSKMARAAQERRGGEDATVIVMDYNAEMILNGVAKGGEPEMAWGVGDAMHLPLPDACLDAYSISFGIRNVADISQARRHRAGRPGQRVGEAFEHLGPVAIKLGQVLATRADIFGLQFAQDLGRLKDKLPPFPLEEAKREIERSLGRPAESLFI